MFSMDGTEVAYLVTPALAALVALVVWWVRRPIAQPLDIVPWPVRAWLSTIGVVFLLWGLVVGWNAVGPALDRRRVEQEGIVVSAEVYDPQGLLDFSDGVEEQASCWLAKVQYVHDGAQEYATVRVQPASVIVGDTIRVKVVPESDLPARAVDDHGCRRAVDSPATPAAVLAIALLSLALRKVVV
jgi:hypothetical protein